MVSHVVDALQALRVCSDASYSWLGETVELPAQVVAHAPATVRRSALVQGMSRRLYGDFFSVGGPRPAVRRGALRGATRRLADRLADVNLGTGCYDPGWEVVARDGLRLVVERSGLRIWAQGADLRPDDPLDRVDVGAVVALCIGNDAPRFSPGYYMALGNRPFDLPRPPLLDRFYLHLREDGAVECMKRATDRLNAIDLAFRLKVVDDPDGFDRCDTAIFAFQRVDRVRALTEMRALRDALADVVEPGTPVLTLRIAAGLAFAEDPGDGGSFGAHRCALLAEAVMRAHERGAVCLDERLDTVAECFDEADTSLLTPYLGPNSPGDLALESSANHTIPEECAPCR